MKSVSQESSDDDHREILQLLKDEEGGLMGEEGIATISFYKGGNDHSFQTAATALRAQLVQVVASNPWLTGRLVKTKGKVRLSYSKSPTDTEIDSLFKTYSNEATDSFKLSSTSPYIKICIDMYKSGNVIVGNGYSTLKKCLPLTILTLSETAPGEFSMIFSMSHVIADGRTYYEILQMLQPGSAIRALSPTRVMSFSEKMRDMCGRMELEWADSTSATCMYTCAMLTAVQASCHAFHVDIERVAAAKAAAVTAGEVPYVTTNDILTSGFFTECGAAIGMMGMDCRERVEGVHKDMAGNYVTALTMDEDTFATPSAVRQMLSTTPYQTTKRPLPGFCGWLFGKVSAKFAMVTNWSSFAGGLVQLEGTELAMHLPVHNPAHVVYDLMVPFASGVGKMGVICWTVSTDEEGLRAALPVGECISKDLFPNTK